MKLVRRKLTSMSAIVLAIATVTAGAESPAPRTMVPSPAPQPNAAQKTVLDALATLNPKPIEKLSPVEARQQPLPGDGVKIVLEKQGKSTAPEPVGKVEDRQIEGAGGEIPIRIYWPAGAGPIPVVFYIHGGGWVIADLDAYDSSARALSNAARAIVVSSHYRQGPEHRFPAAHDDTFAAYQWTLKNAASLGGDQTKIAIAGESAGGNMAASISIRARDTGVQMPVHQVLVYPVAGMDLNTPSYQQNATAKPLNKAMVEWFVKHYQPQPRAGDVQFDLVNAKLEGLPPTTIINAEIDPLRSDGEMLAEKLRAAGVTVEQKTYAGVAHEFFGQGAVVPEAKTAVQQAAKALRPSFTAAR